VDGAERRPLFRGLGRGGAAVGAAGPSRRSHRCHGHSGGPRVCRLAADGRRARRTRVAAGPACGPGIVRRIWGGARDRPAANLPRRAVRRAGGGDLNRAAEIQYSQLPAKDRELKNLSDKLGQLQKEKRMLKEEVDEEDIAEVIAKWTGIPVAKLMSSEKEKLLHMEDYLKKHVIGQEYAIEVVSDCIRRARSGLAEPGRPLGVFLFLGPTGVGKTELAKRLTEFLFDDQKNLTRIDMSEYTEKHSVSRLIGAPPGYVGYDEGGQLTEAVRRKPYAVILFDEIEKAHPEVCNVLLQLFDDGRLTDGKGKTVDFKNTVIIMTSNIATNIITELESKKNYASEQLQQLVSDELKKYFKPEFLNRIDETIIFKKLGLKEIVSIVDLQLKEVEQRLKERNIGLEVSKEVKDFLAKEGFDITYGARPLKRVIQQKIVNLVSSGIIGGKIKDGDKVQMDLDAKNSVVMKIS